MNKTPTIRIVLWAVVILSIVLLGFKNIVPGGNFRLTYSVTKGSPMVKNFASKEKYHMMVTGANDTALGSQVITASPLYFDVHPPRKFPNATISVEYMNPDQVANIRVGVKQNNGNYMSRDLAISFPPLENLPEEWESHREGNLVLWQKNNEYLKKKIELEKEGSEVTSKYQQNIDVLRSQLKSDNKEDEKIVIEEKIGELELLSQRDASRIQEEISAIPRPPVRFRSIDDFFQELPPTSIALQYNEDIASHAKLKNYVPSSKSTVVDVGMRGKMTIATYIGEQEKLQFRFLAQSINRHDDIDGITATVWKGSQKVLSQKIDFSDSGKASGIPSKEQTLEINKDGLSESVYHITLEAPDDVLIKQIVSSQCYVTFSRGMYITDNEEYRGAYPNKEFLPTTIFTDSGTLQLSTPHENGLQTVNIGTKNLSIQKPHEPVKATDLSGVTTIVSPKNDLRIEGDGYFAFSLDALLPLPIVFQNLTESTNLRNFDYIFASYPKAQQQENGWLVAKADLDNLTYDAKNMAHLAIFMDGMAEAKEKLFVKTVTIEFHKPKLTLLSVFQKLRARFFHQT